NDAPFRKEMALAGVNSINWARVMAQITYYFVAASRRRKNPSPFLCRPVISVIFSQAMWRRKWACPSRN
ncbi:hypothetical protein N9X76_02950, partial [Alphaproteobacteria bacterium]|nr:hypothetical protein [Alphaproteobacteria bacterium]